MFEGPPESAYGRVLQETEFFFKVPPGVYNEIVRRMDPKVAVDIPRMCTREFNARMLQLNDAQCADLTALVAAKPNTTDIRREIIYPDSEPILGIRRKYLTLGMETETQYAPITYGFLGMRIRGHWLRKDKFEITVLYIGPNPSAENVRHAFKIFQTQGEHNPVDIQRLPGDHISFDLLEREKRSGVQGTRYRHVHMIGNFCVTNSAKDVFRPDAHAGTG
jgi:hypothetical protein